MYGRSGDDGELRFTAGEGRLMPGRKGGIAGPSRASDVSGRGRRGPFLAATSRQGGCLPASPFAAPPRARLITVKGAARMDVGTGATLHDEPGRPDGPPAAHRREPARGRGAGRCRGLGPTSMVATPALADAKKWSKRAAPTRRAGPRPSRGRGRPCARPGTAGGPSRTAATRAGGSPPSGRTRPRASPRRACARSPVRSRRREGRGSGRGADLAPDARAGPAAARSRAAGATGPRPAGASRRPGSPTPSGTGGGGHFGEVRLGVRAGRPLRERRPVDIVPWAVLLERLTEVPEEGVPAGREGGKRE